jgi:dehydrogenase/reductase SDR family protein 7B
MDKTTAGGMSPGYVASRILAQVESGRSGDVTLAPIFHKAAVYLRTLAPSLYFAIMARRARKQRQKTE